MEDNANFKLVSLFGTAGAGLGCLAWLFLRPPFSEGLSFALTCFSALGFLGTFFEIYRKKHSEKIKRNFSVCVSLMTVFGFIFVSSDHQLGVWSAAILTSTMFVGALMALTTQRLRYLST